MTKRNQRRGGFNGGGGPPHGGSPNHPAGQNGENGASRGGVEQRKKKRKLTYLERLSEIDIPEEIKASVALALKKLETTLDQKEMEFPTSLSSEERKYIHIVAQQMGLKSKSRGSGCGRYLTVFKRSGSSIVSREAVLSLPESSQSEVSALLTQWPVSTRERQDLLPPTDRDRLMSADLRELGLLRSLGRLTPGPPQIPPSTSYSPLTVEALNLPIWKTDYKEMINTIENNQVVLVMGETGSGKTTQIPQMLLENAVTQKRPVRMLCTQPRRLSAITTAERIAAERGEKIGSTVGYQIRLESKLCPKTLLTVCTNGVLLRTLMAGESALATITHIIVDEIHERDRFTDFLLTVIKDCLPKFQHIKLILMSAAVDANLYSNYFGTCPVIRIPGKCYPVSEYYLEDILKYVNHNNKKMKLALRSLETRHKKVAEINEWTKKILAVQGEDKEEANEEGSAREEAVGGAVKEEAVGGKQEEEDDDSDVILEDDCEDGAHHTDMDSALQSAYLNNSEESFARMVHMVMTGAVGVDYQHSVTQVTPLMVASGRGRLTVMEQLLSLGASLRITSSNELTAFGWAKLSHQKQAMDLLKCYGASVGVSVEEESGDGGESPPIEVNDLPHPVELEADDMQRLSAYELSVSDEMCDVDLINSLCYKIHSTEKKGAILIFLPGYDSIVAARDLIQSEEQRYNKGGGRINIYCLHSNMPSIDQKKVFKPSPEGCRKIILSTNIAETSITINDVVYVINSAKIKEINYDSVTGASCLKEVFASQVSALQRRGRAGRCQPGIAFHLVSREKFNKLPKYQTPEILRYPLQELCLHAKLLAPANVPIADFITKAIEPPSLMVVRNAVQLLKNMEAIDGWEEVTALGHHLLELPLPPRLGKMVLIGTILKCLDPVLTIAACLAHKDPFILPKFGQDKAVLNRVKRSFGGNVYSDHMVLVRVCLEWQKSQRMGNDREFCARNFVSAATMEMIHGIKGQVLAQLKGMGFIKVRGPYGDLKDCNINSDNWAVVKAAIVAGMYPNLIRIDREQVILRTQKQSTIRLHPSCTLYDLNENSTGRLAPKAMVKMLPTDWLVYEEMLMTGMIATTRTVTVVSPLTVLLMGGPTRLPLHAISTSVLDDGSDSESEEMPLNTYGRLRLDDWVQFVGSPDDLHSMLQLRHKLHSILLRRLKAPSKGVSQGDDDVIRVVAKCLLTEDIKAGIVSQKETSSVNSLCDSKQWHSSPSSSSCPSPSFTPSRGGRGGYPSTSSGRNTPSGRGAPPRNRNTTSSPRGRGSFRGSSDGDNMDYLATELKNLATGSASKSPPGGGRYFVLRFNGYRELESSFQSSTWVLSDNEKSVGEAFGSNPVIVIFISANGLAQACGKVISKDLRTIRLQWLYKNTLPHHLSRNIGSSAEGPIGETKSGQEISQSVGRQIMDHWQNHPNNHGRHQKQNPYQQPYYHNPHHPFNQNFLQGGGNIEGGMGGGGMAPPGGRGGGFNQKYPRGGYGGGFRSNYRR